MHRERAARIELVAQILDALTVVVTYLSLVRIRAGFHDWWPFDVISGTEAVIRDLAVPHHDRLVLIIVASCIVALRLEGAYDDLPRVRLDTLFLRIVRAMVLAILLTLGIAFMARYATYLSRTLLVAFGATAVGMLFLVRLLLLAVYKKLGSHEKNTFNILVVGSAREAAPLLNALENHPDWGVRVLGVVARDGAEDADPPVRCPILGHLSEDLARLLEALPVHQVYLTGDANVETLRHVADSCEEVGVSFSLDANFLGLRTAQAELSQMDGNVMLSFSSTPRNADALAIKRAADVVLSAAGLVVLSPLFLLVALLCKLEDPRSSVFFSQTRSGLYGKLFTIWKFRSMVSNAEELREGLSDLNEVSGPVFKIDQDPRVTRLGAFIRKTSIDELPQLWNVLKGEMSLVGPRPPIPAEVEHYVRWQRRRLSMRPGITCIWQVSGRNQVDFATWMEMDLEYIDNWSLFLDLKLLLLTVPTVLLRTGC